MPGLLLRSLIPIGFMPMFGPGFSVSLMLCPAYAPLAAAPVDDSSHRRSTSPVDETSMDGSEGMDMPMDPSAAGNAPAPRQPSMPTNGWGQDHTLCPYATSATLGGPTAPFTLSVSKLPETEPTQLAPQIAYFHVPRRAHTARAPPLSA